jgi:xylulokinase
MGVLLCINGTGILNRWIKNIAGKALSYQQINEAASKISIGSNGLQIFPFGNGAERMLGNKVIGACIQNIDLNIHTNAHLFRAAQEGIAFAFRYGMDIMKENGLQPNIIRAGKSNMFLSSVFTKSFVNVLNIPVQLYTVDGSVGAAIGAGLGAKVYKNEQEAFHYFKPVVTVEPAQIKMYDELYLNWKNKLASQLAPTNIL